MEDLIHAKQVIAELFKDLKEDTRQSIKGPLFSLASVPLIEFAGGYSNFMKSVSDSSDAMHRWMTIQMQVYTDLGPTRTELLNKFRACMTDVYKGTLGDEVVVVHDDWATVSHTILLMIKVYGDQLILQVEPEEPAA